MNYQNLTKIRQFIDFHPLVVVATIGEDGTPHGAVVYICADESKPIVYFMTKDDTRKYKNLIERDQMSVTSFDEDEIATLQATGRAFVVHDAVTIDIVSKKILRMHATAEEWLPPIAKLRAGAYVLVGIELTSARLAEYKNKQIGDASIFTEL